VEKTKRSEPKARLSKKQLCLIVIAALLAAAILIGVIAAVSSYSPAVLRYGGVSLGEDTYAYLLACYKYELLVSNISLGLTDDTASWQRTDESGRTYEEIFKEAADREIALRFVAAALFDKTGEGLASTYYTAIETALDEMASYSYDEDMYDVLKDRYGIGKTELKRAALYEAKYKALKEYMFGKDGSGVLDAAYAERLDAFYKENYLLYNVIYLSDEKNAARQEELEERIEAGLGEEGFRDFEVSYSESRVTENYPDGIYINKRVDYTSVFSAELLSAMGSLDGVGKITSARDKNDSGTYYVIRCALPEESYRSEDSKVIHSLSGFTEYAAAALYHEELLDCLTDAEWVTEKQSAYTIAKTVKAQDYNVVRALGF